MIMGRLNFVYIFKWAEYSRSYPLPQVLPIKKNKFIAKFTQKVMVTYPPTSSTHNKLTEPLPHRMLCDYT